MLGDHVIDDYVNDIDSDSSDWEECDNSGDSNMVKCLFCEQLFRTCEETFSHCQEHHNFDIKNIKSKLNLDCFSYIRIINFLRKQNWLQMTDLDNKELVDALNNDFYMKPVDDSDPLLMFDIDGVEPEIVTCTEVAKMSTNGDECNYQDLVKRLLENENKLKETEEQLQITRQQISKMKDFILEYLEDSHVNNASNSSNPDDDGYFKSYAHFSIHQEMLQDEVRTYSYRNAILENKDLFKDKIVLDVGCGTGILSMFAAQAGAAKVIGVDESEIAYQAMDIINENGMQNQISILKGKMEEVNIPSSPVDIIISEWMGYFLLFESMLETVIMARDKYLISGGYLLPNKCNILIAGVSDLESHYKMISFWDNVYGFKMTCLKGDVIKEAAVGNVPADKLITASSIVKNLDLMTCTSANLNFTSSFQLMILEDKPLTAITAWFDTYFDLPNMVYFSTSPNDPTTHWKQTIFYLRQPLIYPKGSCVEGKMNCSRPGFGPRLLKIEITIGEYKEEYILQ